MKRFFILFLSTLFTLSAFCQIQSRQRNIIYVLDCTGSMNGHNGSPNIWSPTKNFLKAELEKEAKENPNSRVTILPFQEKILRPIAVNLNNIVWSNIESTLDSHIKKVTATNICDSWLEAEKYIDQSCDNYIVLMTDGHDNIGGSANAKNRENMLLNILTTFCGKYLNTNGFYVELTSAATLPQNIQNAIYNCKSLHIIDGATTGIPSFGCISPNEVCINSRDLPTDIVLGFSNSGTFNTVLSYDNNSYLTFSIKDNKIKQGQIVLHIESKFCNDIETLNKAIGNSTSNFTLNFQSEDVTITNPELNIILNTTPLRTIDFCISESKIERVKNFLWIKGNTSDTLRWNLNPKYSDEAIKNNSSAMFRIHSDKDLTNNLISFNSQPLTKDSIIIIYNSPSIIELIVPNTANDSEYNLKLTEINSINLDRLNGASPENSQILLYGNITSKTSIIEILFWGLLGIILILILLWFSYIRDQKYPKFKKGIITIQSPYFATLRVKGYRKIILTNKLQTQSTFDKIFGGKILYHINPNWDSETEITPSGKNMRLRSTSTTLICSPQPLLMHGASYEITDTLNPSLKIVININ